jgi:hypothetical protein
MFQDSGRIKWPHAFVVALGFLGAVVLFTAVVRPGSAQRTAAGDQTVPSSEPDAQVAPLKSATNNVLSRFDAIDATDNPCETSTTFVDIPGVSKTFFQGGSAGGKTRSIVMFQGEWIPNTGRALLRLLIDGVVQSGPGDAASPFAAHEGTPDTTNGFNFITDLQTNATSHTAKVQWAERIRRLDLC